MRPDAPIAALTSTEPAATAANTATACQWLVSVRDLSEANLAVAYGVDILDLKEPSEGSLSPVSIGIWKELSSWSSQTRGLGTACAAEHPQLSAALGESEQATSIAPFLPAEFAFAKAGPSDIQSESQLTGLWDTLRSQLPSSVELVAVAYADHDAARSLSAATILNLAARSGFRRILLDTFDKHHGSAIELCGAQRINDFSRLAQRHQFWWALAGSIKLYELAQFPTLFQQRASFPSCVAVRGDVCDGNRTGTLSRQRLQAWADTLHR